jgi:diguanylate cyclase
VGAARGFRLYLTVQAVSLAAFFFTPLDTWIHTLWQVVSGVVAFTVVLTVVRRRPDRAAAAWYCLAFGVLMNASGILVDGFRHLEQGLQTSPSPADVFWLALYPSYATGLAILIRRRTPSPDWAALVDTAVITTGLALLSWVLLIGPGAVNTSAPLLTRMVVSAYPIADLVVASLLVRLLIGSVTRSPAVLLLAGGLACVLTLDLGWAAEIQFGYTLTSFRQHLLEALAMANYALVGAAALHPSAVDIASPVAARPPGLSRPLLVGLTAATLMAPALLAFESWRGVIKDGPAIALGSTVLFLLVLMRVLQLVGRVEGQATLLREMALIDELTGLPNRRAWGSELAIALEAARRHRSLLSLAMIDLDHFKRFNDTFGHPAGDQLLRSAAAAWRGRIRLVDRLARYGGEEFILLLPDADGPQSDMVIGRLRAVTPKSQTFSAGVAVWDGTESADALLDRADRALYAAKQAGRNRTVIAAAGQPVSGDGPGAGPAQAAG